MSKDDDDLFEEAMANLAMPPEKSDDEGEGALAAELAAVEVRPRVDATTPSERQLFEHAMDALDVPTAAPGAVGARRRSLVELERAIRQGRLVPDASLDLHGLTEARAWVSLERCVLASRREGHEVLQVICGRGLHSRDRAVLREALQTWLRGPLLEHVKASYPAGRGPGGRGAWFLVLRPV